MFSLYRHRVNHLPLLCLFAVCSGLKAGGSLILLLFSGSQQGFRGGDMVHERKATDEVTQRTDVPGLGKFIKGSLLNREPLS